MPAYHVCIANQVVGPISEAEVKARLAAGEIHADSLVSTDGGAWARLADALPAPHAPVAQVSMLPPLNVVNPYTPPMAHISAPSALPLRRYGGIGRLLFLVGFVAAVFLGGLIGSVLQFYGAALNFLMTALILIPACFRFKNIGRHPAWCALLFVPLLGLFITFPCFVFPAGYQDHRKLDLPAKIMLVLLPFALIGGVLWLLWSLQN